LLQSFTQYGGALSSAHSGGGGGGSILTTRRRASSNSSNNNNNSNSNKGETNDANASLTTPPALPRVLLIVSDPSVAKKEVKKDMIQHSKASGAKGIYTIEVIFLAILRQQLNLEESIIDSIAF
jgi:hypothetical protein